jgi:hypothetical protein
MATPRSSHLATALCRLADGVCNDKFLMKAPKVGLQKMRLVKQHAPTSEMRQTAAENRLILGLILTIH